MDKIWAKDIKEGERARSVFLVSRKAVPTAKSGKPYLSVTLQDRTGELEARAFERVEELAQAFEEKDYVEVEGQVGTFQGKPQLRIEQVTKSDPATLEASEFVWVPPPEPKKPEKVGFSEQEEAAWRDLAALVEAVADPHLKALIRAFLEDDDVAARLRRAPAAKTVHHAYPGGLLEHTVSCLKLAHRIADHYPQVDRDLLVAGAFFHDLGKVRELGFDRQVEYSDEGRLVGHLVMTAQWIHDKARRVGVPRDLEHHVVHLVLSHHGKLEYGSPKLPMTLEAVLTHEIDELDSRVNSWLNLMGREGGTRRWTDSNNIYGQHIWRGTLPTVQAEKKGPPPEVMTPVIYVPRDASAQQGRGGQAQPQQKRKRQERKHEAPREARTEAAGTAAAAPAAAPAAEAGARPAAQ
jgi:3'-5' exoribonuclease